MDVMDLYHHRFFRKLQINLDSSQMAFLKLAFFIIERLLAFVVYKERLINGFLFCIIKVSMPA